MVMYSQCVVRPRALAGASWSLSSWRYQNYTNLMNTFPESSIWRNLTFQPFCNIHLLAEFCILLLLLLLLLWGQKRSMQDFIFRGKSIGVTGWMDEEIYLVFLLQSLIVSSLRIKSDTIITVIIIIIIIITRGGQLKIGYLYGFVEEWIFVGSYWSFGQSVRMALFYKMILFDDGGRNVLSY